jgi:DNA excision repair protein ERCC-2
VPEKTVFRINVRALAEHLFQEGSIGPIPPPGTSALEGMKAHKKLQERGIPGYRAEVELARLFAGERLDLQISGRADGIYEKEGLTHIEEIKSTRRELSGLRAERTPAHSAQLALYGWLYSLEKGLDRVALDLVYVHRVSQVVRVFSLVRTVGDLAESYGPAVSAFLAWLDGHEGYRTDLSRELSALSFPFPDFRPGQREAGREVFRAIRDKGTLFLQAPTGIGKTIAVLYPALKALGQSHAGKIFFLTAKNAGAAAAETALSMIAPALPHLRWISITAKSKICFLTSEEGNERPPCDPEICPFARDYFVKARKAVLELFNHGSFTRALVEELARKHQVCPFELSLDLSVYCDVVVGDYNYAFDYGARLKRFFAVGKTSFVFLVDEAHNLVDRARSMYSATLSKRRILEVRRASTPAEKKILAGLNSSLLAVKKEYPAGQEAARQTVPAGLGETVTRTIDDFESLMDGGAALSSPALELFWELYRLGTVLGHYDESYRTIVSSRAHDFTLDFLCVDPSSQLQQTLADQRASIFFSGTLTPAAYFMKLIAPDMKAEFFDVPSPFPPENCAHLVHDGLSTRWKDRERNVWRYARIVLEAFGAVNGNQIVFSPSFAFQDALLARLLGEEVAPAGWVIQKPGMTAQEKDDFVAAFERGEGGVRGFAVAGGSFSESIDLAGERLVGVLIFGVGLPQVNIFNDTSRDFFEAKLGNGYAWAYLYPGLNRVLQAAGRVIRSEADRGFVCLIDERYATREYRRLLPEHWEPRLIHEPGDFARALPAGLGG